MAQLAASAEEAHGRLSGGRERLAMAYEPRFDDRWPPSRVASADVGGVASVLLHRLQDTRGRDIAARLTLTGPHRDDVALALGGEPAASFASRGQQRTAALALRLAEARYLRDVSGEQPVLLLDDVLSELDEHRRASVLDAIDADQMLITSPDPDRFASLIAAGARRWDVRGGCAVRGDR